MPGTFALPLIAQPIDVSERQVLIFLVETVGFVGGSFLFVREVMAAGGVLSHQDRMAATKTGKLGFFTFLPEPGSEGVNLPETQSWQPRGDFKHRAIREAANHTNLQAVGGSCHLGRVERQIQTRPVQ
jgi:hypothetical protein